MQELTAEAVFMLRDEFLKVNGKEYLEVSKGEMSFTVFPIWEGNEIKGLVKFGYPFEVPSDGLVEVLRGFVEAMVARSRGEEEEE